MPKILQRDAIVAALLARGAVPCASNSRKYQVFSHFGSKLYVGASGSVRTGRSYTDSRPIAERQKQGLFEDGVIALGATK